LAAAITREKGGTVPPRCHSVSKFSAKVVDQGLIALLFNKKTNFLPELHFSWNHFFHGLIAFYAMAGHTTNNRRSSQSLHLFAFFSDPALLLCYRAAEPLAFFRAHSICPNKFNSTLKIDQDKALSTTAIELKLSSDWLKIYCQCQ